MSPADPGPDFWAKMEVIISKKFDTYDKEKAKVRHNELFNNFASQKKEIDAVKKQFSVLSEKISTLEQIDGFKDAKIAAETIKAIQDSITALERKTVNKITDDDNFKLFQLFQNSCREQRSRSWTARISNYQSPHCREKITMYKIYNEIILPSLQVARKNGLIDYVPQYWGDVIEYAHHLPFDPKKKEIPQALFRFHSRVFLTAFMISKRPIMDEYTARLNKYKTSNQSVSPAPYFPNRQLKIQYDSTKLNKSVQTFLHSTKLVSRTKISGETVAFQIKAGTKWWKVQNPYADTLIGMTKPFPGQENLFSSSPPPPLAKFNKLPYADRGLFFPNSTFCNPLITDEDLNDMGGPPQASNVEEFPPINSAASAVVSAVTAAAVTSEGEGEGDQDEFLDAVQRDPASPAQPSTSAPAETASQPAAEAEQQKQPAQPQLQKILPQRNAKKLTK